MQFVIKPKNLRILLFFVASVASCQKAPVFYYYSFEGLDEINCIQGNSTALDSFKGELSFLMKEYDNTTFNYSQLTEDIAKVVNHYQCGELWGTFYLIKKNESLELVDKQSFSLEYDKSSYDKQIVSYSITRTSSTYSSDTYTHNWTICISTGMNVSGVKAVGYKIGGKKWYWDNIKENKLYSSGMITTSSSNPTTFNIQYYYTDHSDTDIVVDTQELSFSYPFTTKSSETVCCPPVFCDVFEVTPIHVMLNACHEMDTLNDNTR